MSKKYDLYLEQHKNNVEKAFRWLKENCEEIFKDLEKDFDIEHLIRFNHDASKTSIEEYEAYDAYFYKSRSFSVVENFNRAWLHHIHSNPHHWQHWVLINDDKELGYQTLDMPLPYIIEMICDWWSFSWKDGNLSEIFKWYDDRKNYILMSDKTKEHVLLILETMKQKLEEDK